MTAHGESETDGAHHDPAPPGRRRVSGLGVLGGAVLGGFAAVIILAVLLVLSPASFISLLPGTFAEDGPHRAVEWVVAGLVALAAAALARMRGRAQGFRSLAVVVLLLVAGGFAIHAATPDRDRGGSSPTPDNTCVAYSGGRHTCPGG